MQLRDDRGADERCEGGAINTGNGSRDTRFPGTDFLPVEFARALLSRTYHSRMFHFNLSQAPPHDKS